jgi:O-antigen/teichoic acid export membrane protein
MLVSGVNFVSGVLFARFLGLDEFGRFTLAWMVVLFASAVQQALLIDTMMSIAPKQPRDGAGKYFGAVMLQAALLNATIAVLVLIFGEILAVYRPDWIARDLAWPLAMACAAHHVQDFLRRYFFVRGRAGTAFALDLLRYGGQTAILVALFSTLGNLMNSGLTLWAIAGMAAVTVCVGICSVDGLVWDVQAQWETARRHWVFAKWMLPSGAVQWLAGQGLIAAGGLLLGAAAVGALRAAQNLVGLLHILFQGMENFVPTSAARALHRFGITGLKDYLRRVLLVGGAVTGFVVAIVSIDPQLSLRLVYGDDFAGSGHLLRWWGVVYLVIFVNLVLISSLRALEVTKAIFLSVLAVVAFVVVAAYPLITTFGADGVLLGFLGGELVRCGVLFAKFHGCSASPPDQQFAK